MEEKKLFLLDAYALIFRSYYAFIRNPRINSKGLNTSAIFGFVNTLEDVLRKENPNYLAVAFDMPAPTFRHEMYKEYKANRDATPEDIKSAIPYIKDILKAYNIPIVGLEGFEADDVVGTLAKQASKEGFTVYMMTPDKDYAQLIEDSIFMYKPARSGKGVEIIGKSEICEKYHIDSPTQFIDILALWGDTSDNIPGVPGVGEKTAIKLINKYKSIDGIYENIHELKGKQKENFENSKELVKISKKLVTIVTDCPVNFDEKEFVLDKPDLSKIKELYTELEFRNLLQRTLVQYGESVANPEFVGGEEVVQGDLFANAPQPVAVESSFNTVENTKHDYILVDSEKKREKLFEKLENSTAFCFDTETTGLNAVSSSLIGVAFSVKAGEAFYLPVPEDKKEASVILNPFKRFFGNSNIKKIGQNIKYDMLILSNYEIQVEGELFDTMIAHYLIQPELRHNLNYLAEIYLNYRPISIESLIGKKGKSQQNMKDVPVEKVAEYAGEDADITFRLAEILEKDLEKNNLTDLYYQIEAPLIYVLTEMERVGVSVNVDTLDEIAANLNQKIGNIEKKIYEYAETEFNIASPKQLGEILFNKLKITDKPPRTKTKQYKTNEETLEKLKDKHAIIEEILEYRGYKKLLSTYVEALPKLINPKTGRIHTSFNQALVATGRLSSNNPNLQNIPIRDDIGKQVRKAFNCKSDDYVFLSADYSQVELRLMAHLSQDKNMIEAFNSGIDIHTATAAKINKIAVEEVTKEMRSNAKSANFGIIYGVSAFGLARNLNISSSEAKKLIDGYFESYPQVKEYMQKSVQIARDKGFVETIMGRRRYLPDINSRNGMVRGMAERNAVNAPIQGSASDIIKIAMNDIFKQFKEQNLKSKMLTQVHDELNFEVLKEELETVKEIVKSKMENAVQISVPLSVEMGVGVNWLEAH